MDGALRFLINSCILDIDAVIFGTENRPKRPGNSKIFASGGLGNYLAQPGLVGTDIRTVELPVVSPDLRLSRSFFMICNDYYPKKGFF